MVNYQNLYTDYDAQLHNRQATLGASYFIEDILEEMSDIQTILDAVAKTLGKTQ